MQQHAAWLRSICLTLSLLILLAGGLGMVASFFFLLAAKGIGDVNAGSSGFVAGSIFVGSGLISLTILASRSERTAFEKVRDPELD